MTTIRKQAGVIGWLQAERDTAAERPSAAGATVACQQASRRAGATMADQRVTLLKQRLTRRQRPER